MNFNQQNLDAMLKLVSGKLNVSADVLKKELEEGKFEKALNGMNSADSAKFQQILKNPKIMEQFM